MKASDLAGILNPVDSRVSQSEAEITTLLTDSRKLVNPAGVIFFAIPTKHDSGCRYVDALVARGVKNYVLPVGTTCSCTGINIWWVNDVVGALQQLAAHHRVQFDIPVVGITGSNGKTIVKDWIVQLIGSDYHVAANPKSYNSQIGVPLSVWQLNADNRMGVFEAGISETGEMARLQRIIAPTIGIFTNIGQAHDEHFLSRSQKVAEKLQLFTHCDTLIYSTDHKEIDSVLAGIESFRTVHRFTWGISAENDLQIINYSLTERSTTLVLNYHGQSFEVVIPFIDRASRENVMHCIALMLHLGYAPAEVSRRCLHLTPVEMRLEINEGINNCLLINDSYSLDINSLSIALDFLQHDHQHHNKTLIISDFAQSGLPDAELYPQVASLARERGVSRMVCIGPALSRNRQCFSGLQAEFFDDTDAFLSSFDTSRLQNETVLLKGARCFRFEKIARLLQRKSHETIMEVNLDALVHNLNQYRSRLAPTTRLMAMVKASSYGAGKVEVASVLQNNHVDYLTVAYADEGVELRRNGITLPIMVMNPEETAFDDIVKHHLEPDIYSLRILDSFARHAALYGKRVAIHIELDTGMHRLGFGEADLEVLSTELRRHSTTLEVRSIFSHLACSEDPAMDDFTHRQIDHFRDWSQRLITLLGQREPILCHILNSSGISRFPEAQMDMVRLGIGLYGVAPEPEVQARLQSVSRLITRISQVKDIPEGDSVGYNRRWVAQRPSRIAILPIGYADGINRHLGLGNGRVVINGHEAPLIGSVCMDMCFVDVTDIVCNEGDEAILFGDGNLLQRNAAAAGTIPYELLTAVSPRVKRVYRYSEFG